MSSGYSPFLLFLFSLLLGGCAESEDIVTVDGSLIPLADFSVSLDKTAYSIEQHPSVAFTGEGIVLINYSTISAGEGAALYDVETGKKKRDFVTDPFPGIRLIGAVATSEDGRWVAVAGYDFEPVVIVWDAVTGEVAVGPIRMPETGEITALAFNSDASELAVGTAEGISIWEISGSVLKETRLSGRTEFETVRGIEFSSTGDTLLTSPPAFWSRETGERMEDFEEEWGYFNAAGFLDHKRKVIIGGRNVLYLFSPGAVDPIGRIRDHYPADPLYPFMNDHTITSLDVSVDGRRFATGDSDGYLKVWDAATGELIALGNVSPIVVGVAFSPTDPSLLASLTTSGSVQVWRIQE